MGWLYCIWLLLNTGRLTFFFDFFFFYIICKKVNNMGSLLSSPKAKYDTSPQKQAQITQKAARHRQQSARAQRQQQKDKKTVLKKEIERQLNYATGDFYLVQEFNDKGKYIYDILDGMDKLLYLKNRTWSEGSQKFMERMGINLKSFIPRYMKKYPEEKVIISNLKTKFKAIYGYPYNKWNGWIAGYSRDIHSHS